jgi:N-methylhydantoinase B
MGIERYNQSLRSLNDYAERLARDALQGIPDGCYRFEDVMDDDGQGHENIPIRVSLRVQAGEVSVDFSGTSSQVKGNINCPLSVAAAAVFYVFRCLMPPQTPPCAGSFRPIELAAPEGCLVNAIRPAAVAAGNVETSTRIVDAVMGALAQAVPQSIPAASQGSMNNLAMGSTGDHAHGAWDYYETIGGGMGVGASGGGLSGVQTHMTNTLNTPVEALEMRYPVRVIRYALRRDSAGAGERDGGEGLLREYEFLVPTRVSLLTERRVQSPWGLQGGGAAACGINLLNGEPLPGKLSFSARPGDRLVIKTPGGGGFGAAKK